MEVVLVRHANSEFNWRMDLATGIKDAPQGKESLEVKFALDLIDCGISEEGLGQAKATRVSHPVTVVLASPLKRALLTAYHIFRNDKVRLVAEPLLSEMLNSACDFAFTEETISTCKELGFDYSALQEASPHWPVDHCTNEAFRTQVAEIAATSKSRQEVAERVVQGVMRGMQPKTVDSLMGIKQRALAAKEHIKKKYAGERVAVVSHFRFLEAFSAESFGADGRAEGGLKLHNCEVRTMML